MENKMKYFILKESKNRFSYIAISIDLLVRYENLVNNDYKEVSWFRHILYRIFRK